MGWARRHPFWLIGAVGLGIRLFLAFHFYGNGDLFTFEIVAGRTEPDLLHSYAGNVGAHAVLYPYPPGYLPWLLAALKLSRTTELPFHGVVQLLPILADIGIAVAVAAYLGHRGATLRTRLTAFAVVMFGPVFVAVSGYHGQIDPVAILPAVLALLIWERRPGPRRAVAAGALIGIGGLLKTVPMLLLVPLLVSARSTRERATLVAAALAVYVLPSLPFALAEPDGYRKALAWTGVPGRGGLSVVADPSFAVDRRLSVGLALSGTPNHVANALSRAGGPITIVAVVALAAFLWRCRPATIDAIVLLWLTVFVFSPNFILHYLVWALPFFLMAGHLRATALLQLVLIPAVVINYLSFGATTRALAVVYVVSLVALWLGWVVTLAVAVRGTVRAAPGAAPVLT